MSIRMFDPEMNRENCQQHPACLEISKLISHCDFTRTKSTGPGGQHRNKVESMVIATHRASQIRGSAAERSSQHANKTVAIERLRQNLAIQLRSPCVPETVSSLWRSRCRGKKIVCSVKHRDFACLLAEALDWIVDCEFSMPMAAEKLNCTTSQLIKFVKQSDLAFAWLAEQRKSAGLRPLK